MLTRKVTRALPLLKTEQGSVIISFAVLLPLLIVLLALCLNSLKMFISKAKVSDVSAEVGLMVSATSRVGEGNDLPAEMKSLLIDYIKEFFPESTKTPELSISYSSVQEDAEDNTSYLTYKPNIVVDLPFPFYHRQLSEGKKTFSMTSSGITIKKKAARPVDIVFVIDFSASQQGAGLRLLKSVFKELSEFVLASNAQSKIAMVPFSTGVAVKYPETNQRGAAKAGCSVLFVPKPQWAIDYGFWGDKSFNNKQTTLTQQLYNMDYYRYKYYSDWVAKSKPALALNTVHENWCRKNASFGKPTGQVNYSCFDKRFMTQDLDGSKVYADDIFTLRSRKIITDEYAKAVKIRAKQVTALTVEHDEAIDYPATLEKMFGDEAIMTFPMLWTAMEDPNYRPFGRMCHHAGWLGHKGDLANAKPYSWLIELTNDAKQLNEFQDMNAQGYTATSAGLVRSVPVMMKGRNQRKVFVIMSDGDDSLYPQKVTDRYLKQYKLCERIKDGILERSETNTKRVDIYYVSTTNSKTRVKYWRDNCTGEGNAATALNRSEVVSLIKGYLSDEIGSFTQ